MSTQNVKLQVIHLNSRKSVLFICRIKPGRDEKSVSTGKSFHMLTTRSVKNEERASPSLSSWPLSYMYRESFHCWDAVQCNPSRFFLLNLYVNLPISFRLFHGTHAFLAAATSNIGPYCACQFIVHGISTIGNSIKCRRCWWEANRDIQWFTFSESYIRNKQNNNC